MVVVVGFLATTVGLLGWAGVRSWLEGRAAGGGGSVAGYGRVGG